MDVNFTNTGRGRVSICKPCLGLSLVELIIALSISAILMGMAAPSFSHLLKNSRMTTDVNALVGAIYQARSESAKRRQRVIICKSRDGGYCDNGAEWGEGWIVFADIDNDRTRGLGEPLIKVHQAFKSGNSLMLGAFPSSNYIIFYPTGISSSNGTFTFCDNRGAEHAKAVILWKSGRVRLSRIHPNGSPLECP